MQYLNVILSTAAMPRRQYWLFLVAILVARFTLRMTLIPGVSEQAMTADLPEFVQRFLLLALLLVVFRRLRDLSPTARIGFGFFAAGVIATAYIDFKNANTAIQAFAIALGAWPSAPSLDLYPHLGGQRRS